MRHWFSAEIKDRAPWLYEQLPVDFGIGCSLKIQFYRKAPPRRRGPEVPHALAVVG